MDAPRYTAKGRPDVGCHLAMKVMHGTAENTVLVASM